MRGCVFAVRAHTGANEKERKRENDGWDEMRCDEWKWYDEATLYFVYSQKKIIQKEK